MGVTSQNQKVRVGRVAKLFDHCDASRPETLIGLVVKRMEILLQANEIFI